MIRKIFYILLLFITFPVSAQERFVTLDWDELPAPQTLPTVSQTIPLLDDYRSYIYDVKIEFPEFVNLDAKGASLLKEKNEALLSYPQAKSSIVVSAHKGTLEVYFVPVVYREGTYQRINSYKLSVTRTPIPMAAWLHMNTLRTRQSTSTNSVLATGKFVKIRVPDTGVYRITYAELRNMGFSNPDKVRLYGYGGYLLSQKFAEHPADDLPQVPTHRLGDAVLFYARGTVQWKYANGVFLHERNYFSDYGYYFLTEGDETPAQLPVESSLASEGVRIDAFENYALYEKEAYSWGHTGRELYDSYDYVSNNTQDYTFKLPDIIDSKSIIKVAFTSNYTKSGSQTFFAVAVNSQTLGTTPISSTGGDYYIKATEGVATLEWTGSKSENTKVTITHQRDAGISGRLNYITLNYRQKLHLRGSFLTFRSTASVKQESTFVLTGATASTVVWDVTSPTEHKQIKGTLDGNTYIFTIPASGTMREFVAVNTVASFGRVEKVENVSNQNLHALSNVDMVIISADRPAIIQQAERLAQAHRQMDKLTVLVVPATQIYNEFSSGTPDATAYRRLMKMFYSRSTSTVGRPKYLLLFGDAAYDNRMVTSSWKQYKLADFLLTYQFESSLNEATSYGTDDYFGFLDDEEGTDLIKARLDIGIGRFPVRTPNEAKNVVDKTIAYMGNSNVGPWKRVIGLVADDPEKNFGDDFMEGSETVALKVQRDYPSFKAERVFTDAYKREASATSMSFPQATKRLLQLFDQGMLIVNYNGHSGTTGWAEEKILTADDVSKMTSPRLPFWFTASCDFARLDAVDNSAGEIALLNPKGGAIALFSTTRVVYDPHNRALQQAMYNHIFTRPNGERLRLGDVARLAKNDNLVTGTPSYIQNAWNFSLLGDPALTLAYPDYEIKIDEFDGPLSTELPFMKAGAKVTIKGHVLTPEGTLADNFTGIIHPFAYDSKETVTTLNNAGEGAFTYSDHNKVLYSGLDSVRKGRFEITFPVPLDINYSDENGNLNLYACSSDKREAGGSFNRFLVGGTADDASSDEAGPKMYLYLNTPDFAWGAQVNETPFFVAQLADEDGINTVGNGVGHDLSLCIDGKTTYSLNDYYTPDGGNYKKGVVSYSLPTLSEGKHSLTFRAWDLMNNSSVKQLDFEVVKGLKPQLFSIACNNSPARENTTFTLSHDRAGSQIDVRIAVCDFSGRELWVHTEKGISADSNYSVFWDLCSNGGQRLSAGVYLYRASITTQGSKESTKTEKIVILAQ